jgi:hypothetical protein
VRNVEDGTKAGFGNPVGRGLRELTPQRGTRPHGRRRTCVAANTARTAGDNRIVSEREQSSREDDPAFLKAWRGTVSADEPRGPPEMGRPPRGRRNPLNSIRRDIQDSEEQQTRREALMLRRRDVSHRLAPHTYGGETPGQAAGGPIGPRDHVRYGSPQDAPSSPPRQPC